MPENLREAPVGIFLVIIAVILIAPLLSNLIRLPSIAGLILAGIVIGPFGIDLLERTATIELLGTVGVIYLMFDAGASIEYHQFNRLRNRSILFGTLTFVIPLSAGMIVGGLLGFPLIGALLLGSIFASHTLVAFPIATRLGIKRHDVVAVTTGATIITNIGALLVLAGVVGTVKGEATSLYMVQLILLFLGYTGLTLLGIPLLGRFFFNRYQGHAVEFQFVLLVIFLAAFLAELIGMEAIVGAFLAGLAINTAIPGESAVMERVVFIGESLFIPIFLISIGMLINPLAFVTDMRTLLVSVIFVLTIFSTKFVASWITGQIFGYSADARMVMGGLSLAQAAATLAATLVGVQLGLLDEAVFNGIIIMILITCVASPLIVERYGAKLVDLQSSESDIAQG